LPRRGSPGPTADYAQAASLIYWITNIKAYLYWRLDRGSGLVRQGLRDAVKAFVLRHPAFQDETVAKRLPFGAKPGV
jgi:hypothetical protein